MDSVLSHRQRGIEMYISRVKYLILIQQLTIKIEPAIYKSNKRDNKIVNAIRD